MKIEQKRRYCSKQGKEMEKWSQRKERKNQ